MVDNVDNPLSSVICTMVSKNTSYRLHQYVITVEKDGQIFWKKPLGNNTVIIGKCIILEDILFIDAQQKQQLNLSKVEFFAKLRQLNRWDKTTYFCKRLSLYECNTENKVPPKNKRWPCQRKLTKKEDRNEPKIVLKFKDPKRTDTRIFFQRLSTILNSIIDLTGRFREQSKFVQFKFLKSYVFKRTSFLGVFVVRIVRMITRATHHVFLIATSSVVSMFRYCKKYYHRRLNPK